MHIITTARTVSECWDDAPSMFSICLSERGIERIKELHELIKDEIDVNAIEMRLYGQTWSLSHSIGEMQDKDSDEYYFSDSNDSLWDEGKQLLAIENEGGIQKLQTFIDQNTTTQRVECEMVTIWSHGIIQFQATPKHCGDSMVVQSNTIKIEDLKLDTIYIDNV